MQARSFAASVVVAGLLLIFTGISHAGGYMHHSSGDEGPTHMRSETSTPDRGSDMGGEYGPTAGDHDDFNEALGAGTVPVPDDANSSEMESDPWHAESEGE